MDFWMHEKSLMDFSAQRIARLSNSLVLKMQKRIKHLDIINFIYVDYLLKT